MTENSVRHIETLREMDSMKKEYQIRCSHYELELFKNENRITCVICGKNWDFLEERGYSHKKQAYSAERNFCSQALCLEKILFYTLKACAR
jgi:hypothetical protein